MGIKFKLKLFLIFLISTCLIVASYFYLRKQQDHQFCVNNLEEEIDARFFGDDHKFLFTARHEGTYELLKYESGQISILFGTSKYIFSPFYFENRIQFLLDSDGSENFLTSDSNLNNALKNIAIHNIFSFFEGKLLFIFDDKKRSLYSLSGQPLELKCILNNISEVHKVIVDSASQNVVVSSGNKIIVIDLRNKHKPVEVFTQSDSLSNRIIPFISRGYIYFSTNEYSEFYQVYRLPLKNLKSKPVFLYKIDHDIILPKTINNNLFYVEVNDGEYLLRKFDLNSKKITNITNTGVVYDYKFLSEDTIGFIYSDINTPKSFITYSVSSHVSKNCTQNSNARKINLLKLFNPVYKSNAYLITCANIKKKGVIIFFHPGGLHSDFSPRWDHTLIKPCMSGYVVLSPNNPMSFGYGKRFLNSSYVDAINDIEYWRYSMNGTYKHLPKYFLSSSSGNILMEDALVRNQHQVAGIISFFGLASNEPFLPNVPALYILGKTDPYVNYKSRLSFLSENSDVENKVHVFVFENEGHGLHWPKDICLADSCILQFLSSHQIYKN